MDMHLDRFFVADDQRGPAHLVNGGADDIDVQVFALQNELDIVAITQFVFRRERGRQVFGFGSGDLCQFDTPAPRA